MSSVSGLGPVNPSNTPGDTSLGPALEAYAKLLAHPNPLDSQNLQTIAQQTVALDKLAHSVISAASPAIRSIANDLEHLLQSPLFNDVSILTASNNYLKNPSTAELSNLVQELCHNKLALGLMCVELTLLSSSMIKNPNPPAA
ncbi:MAG: hypothetical protein ACRDF4_00690 [Rhabdochlamydiaceae bacterium]